MNVSDAFYEQLLKKVSKWKKKKKRKKLLPWGMFICFPFYDFSFPPFLLFFPPSVKAEVFIAYFQLGVFIVQIPASFNSSTLAKKCCYCFPTLQTGCYCLLGPLCKNVSATVCRVPITVSKYPELNGIY